VCAVYVAEKNVKVSGYIHHRPYFTHKLKKPIINPNRKISKEPAAELDFQVLTSSLHHFIALLHKLYLEVKYTILT